MMIHAKYVFRCVGSQSLAGERGEEDDEEELLAVAVADVDVIRPGDCERFCEDVSEASLRWPWGNGSWSTM